ncbi:MAG: phosphotransferase [bacterium]
MYSIGKTTLDQISDLLRKRGYSFDIEEAAKQIKNKLHRVVLIVEKDAQKYVFKYLNSDNPYGKKWFDQEVKVLEKILPLEFQTNKIVERFNLPVPWMIISYVRGIPIGNVYQIDDDILKHWGGELTDFLASSLENLSKIIDIEEVGGETLKYRQQRIEEAMEIFYNYSFFTSYRASIQKMYEKVLPMICDKNYYSFCHSDLRPVNIIISTEESASFSIIDWEFSKKNLITTDVAFIYNATWSNPDWQKSFLNSVSSFALTPALDPLLYFQVMFYLASDICTIKNLISTKKNTVFHSDNLSSEYLFKLLDMYEDKFDTLMKKAAI